MRTCTACHVNYPDEMDFCPRDATPLPPPKAETLFDLSAGLSRKYRIVRRIGEGGMGAVFLAEQLAVGNRQVALKVLRRKLLDDPDFLHRFQDEAASMGRIRHPNVVTVYECGQTDDGAPYIAVEFLEGESLRQTLERQGSLPLKSVCLILQKAALGLHAAYKLGIIHRDLKPDNILLTHDDEDQPV
jgi:serine/threonine-protein kinase